MEVIGAIASSRLGSAPERFFNSWRGWPHLPRALGCTVLCALLLTASAACFGVTTYTYDASKRLASVSYADSTQIRYGYNLAGNIVSRVVGRVTDPVYTLDVDGSVSGSKYNALTDGLHLRLRCGRQCRLRHTARRLGHHQHLRYGEPADGPRRSVRPEDRLHVKCSRRRHAIEGDQYGGGHDILGEPHARFAKPRPAQHRRSGLGHSRDL